MKTAEFGQPCRVPDPGRCRICGEKVEPRIPGQVDALIDASLCDRPDCYREARREIGR